MQAIFCTICLSIVVANLGIYLFKKVRLGGDGISISPNGFFIFAIIGLLFGSALGLAGGPSTMGIGVPLGFGLLISLAQPVAAISFFLTALLLRPWEVIPDNILLKQLPTLLPALCLLSWVLNRLKTHQFRLVWNRSMSFFVLLLCWFCVSAIVGNGPLKGWSLFFDAFFPIVAIWIIIFNSPSSRLDIRAMLGAVTWGVIGAIAVAIYTTIYEPKSLTAHGRLEGPGIFGNSNDLAAIIIFVLPIAVHYFASKKTSLFSRALSLLPTLILIVGLYYAQSRAATLSIGAILVAYLCFVSRGVGRLVPLFAAGIIIPLLMVAASQRGESDLSSSGSSRANYLVTGLKMLKKNPIIGVGMGNYPVYYDQFSGGAEEYGQRTAHSSWVLAFSENGIIGFFLFAGLFIISFKEAYRYRRNNPGLFLSLVGYGVVMSFLSHTYVYIPYLLFALIFTSGRVERINE